MVSISIVENVVNFILYVMGASGLFGLAALMTVESFGIPPLPSEIILPFAGFLVATGTYSFPAAFAAAMAGGLAGSLLAYSVGRWGRQWLFRSRPGALGLDPRYLDSMDRFFRRRGEVTVAISRLLPVVRSYISYPAGTAKMQIVRFSLYTLLGAAPFTVLLIYAGYVLRSKWEAIIPYFRIADYFAAAIILLGIVYLVLRWRNVITAGFPPRLVRITSASHPEEAGPSPTKGP
jgi:membrane protein DedA with SNARE-associated domain